MLDNMYIHMQYTVPSDPSAVKMTSKIYSQNIKKSEMASHESVPTSPPPPRFIP